MLAYYRREPGGPTVRQLLDQARHGELELSMAVVNLGEVFYRTVRESGPTRGREILREMKFQPIQFHDVDEALALAGAEIKGEHTMSYADCIAAALALRLDAALATGDPEFRQVEDHVRILWLDRAVPEAPEPRA
jgi:predicted nucleic acid-binding protein